METSDALTREHKEEQGAETVAPIQARRVPGIIHARNTISNECDAPTLETCIARNQPLPEQSAFNESKWQANPSIPRIKVG